MGSVQTETICVIRRSVKERVDCAETRLERVNVKDQQSAFDKFGRQRTHFPKKSLPSMMTLTFLNPILVRAGQSGRDRCKSLARVVSRGPCSSWDILRRI